MERGMREMLEQAEGRGSRGADSDDDIFGFRQRAVSEEMLRNLRLQNQNNIALAIATLRGDGPTPTNLPSVYGAHRTGQGLPVAIKRPPRRKQSGLPRPQTPSEVRDSAEREMSQREQAQQRGQVRQPQHQPPGQQTKLRGKISAKQPSNSAHTSAGEGWEDSAEKAPMHDDSRVLFAMLDWQKECRLRRIDTADILKLQPRAMFDKEFGSVERALHRHNRILRDYISAATPSHSSHPKDEDDQPHGDTHSIAAHSVISNFSAATSQTRGRREQRLQQMLTDARELRSSALAIVRQGGVDMLNKPASLDLISPTARNLLSVLHSLLETGLSDDIGLVEGGTGGGMGAPQAKSRGAALRKMLIELQAHQLASQKLSVGKKRPYDDARLLPSHNTTKRQRAWQEQVQVYSSWDDGASSEEPPAASKKKDALQAKTMMLLRASDRWTGVDAGDEAGANVDLEAKLAEIQRRNKRNARMAVRTTERGPARFVLYDSDESEEDLYEARRQQQQRRAAAGYAADATTEGEEDEAALSAGGFKDALPQDRRRLREIAAMRKARIRGEHARAHADMTWVAQVLPDGATDNESAEEVDDGFLRGPLAKQVGAQMAKGGAAFEKSRAVGSMEQKLIKMRADANLARASGAHIGQTQEKIYQEVHKIRKLISGEIRSIFAGIAAARERLAEAKRVDDAEHRDLLTQSIRDLLTQEAQKLLIDAEMRANLLRERYQRNPDMNVEFMPEYLRNFLMANVSAQTMFDRGRLEAVQARAAQLELEDRQREQRELRRRKAAGGAAMEAEGEDQGEFSDSGLPVLTTIEKAFLKELLGDAAQVNVMLLRVEERMAQSTESDDRDAMEAADNAMEATRLLEASVQMYRALKKKLKSTAAKRLRPLLPIHLRNLADMALPLQQMWREGHTEPAICDALDGLRQIDKKIKAAKSYLVKFERGEDLSQEEEDLARTLLEAALVDAVRVRERARASMLDPEAGGAGISIKRFPKHVANLLVSEESVIVLWEKGLIDKQICGWLDAMVGINMGLAEAQKLEYKAMMLGETKKGLQALAQVDHLQHEADLQLQQLRREIDQAIVKGLQRSRLPPHLLNVLKDRRVSVILFRQGKLDPVIALFEQHADRMLKGRRDSQQMEKRAAKLLDAENRKAALAAAGQTGEAALEEMLQLRAQILIGGILPSELAGGSALAGLFEEVEEGMDDGGIDDTLMQKALEAMGLSQELIDRLKKATRERRQVVFNFHEIEWERLVGKPAAYLPRPSNVVGRFGVDSSRVQVQELDVNVGFGGEGVETFSGLFFSQPVEIEWIETSLERPTDPKMSNLPVLDDVHPMFKDLEAPLRLDADDDGAPTDAGMTQTDVYIEQKERRQQKKYDSDDDDEPDKQGKKKKMKNVARGRLEGKARSGITVDVRRKINDMIIDAKRTLMIDISELELPYIPKQVLDCVYLEQLLADKNLLDEVDPAIGRMGNLSVLSMSWNRIESPLPAGLWELDHLRTLNLDHNQIDEIPGDVAKLSSLTKLRLDANNLDSIPPQMGERTNLKYLSLDKNNLVDLPINMKRMQILSTLTLSRNTLAHVPKCVFSMKKLKTLHLHYNQIPVFPTDMDKLKNITDLNFGANLLTALPPMLSNLVTLKKFDVSKNEIRTLGSEVKFLTNLQMLALSYNLFQALPEELEYCVQLERLAVNSNKLTYLPQNLTRLVKLEVLDLRNNAFIALVPALGRMSSITSLRVEGNDIRTPPPYVCDLETKAMLRFLDRIDQSILGGHSGHLDFTNLTVPPYRVLVQKGYTKGRRVFKDKFKTVPEVPVFLTGFQFAHGMWTGMGAHTRGNITHINLAGNGIKLLNGHEFSGFRDKCLVPHMMAACRVPKDGSGWEVDPLSRLERLQLQGNRLEEIPEQFEYLTALTFVDLTGNSLERLSGEHIAPLTNLTHLNLHNNPKLRRLPSEMGLYDSLTFLDVSQCMLVSPPPVVVQRGCRPIINYLRKLYDARASARLDLDGEQLLHVPIDVLELTGLSALSLRDNFITVIPVGIASLSSLYSLRLDSNYIGRLPEELGVLTGLTELGLSRNLLQEVDKNVLLNYQSLRVLDLSFNQLRLLPVTICELSRLTDLDASSNSLPTVPVEMHRLTNLTRLRLHRNVLRLPLKDLADEADIGVLFEFLRTCANAKGDPHRHYKITPSLHLDLSRRGYKVLPEEVLRFTALTTLKLSRFGMEYMTQGISSLRKLRYLELHDNRLRSLPDSMTALSELERLSLSRNWLARLPYCLSTMAKLQDLQVDGNQLSVIFSDIRNLTSLTELNARSNCLRQVTPELVHLENLRVLDLSENQLTFVPPGLAVMTHLERISLRANYITELPTEWHALAGGEAVVFDVSCNGLKSPPPEVVARGSELVFEYLRRFHFARASGVLDLSDMGLTYLPADVMRFYKTHGVQSEGLKRLILDGNRLAWLPNYLRVMTTLTHISLTNCALTKLPYFIGDLRELSRLDLSGNDIQSPPNEIVDRGVHAMVRYMRAVDGAWWTKELDMSGQRFAHVPLEICDIDSLTSLKMHSQYFKDIPAEIGRLTALTLLNLQHCALVELPESIGDCYNLRELVLNNNKLALLPRGIGSCTALTTLRLHENLLEELPAGIGSCTLLQDLRLFNNNMLTLPVELGNLVFLPALRLSSNQLSSLTIGVAGLALVADFLVADNFLEALPPQIGLLTSITRLRVTNNRLQHLPGELGNLHNMTELGVADNQLRELPALGHLTALRSLLVANNPLVLPPDRIVRKGTFAIVNYLRVLADAGGAPAEVVERGRASVAAFHDTLQQGVASQKLNLRARLLEGVPFQVKELQELRTLTELDLECNLIQHLGDAGIGALHKLATLRLSYNQILSLPPDFAKLSSLTVLHAAYNFLPAFPLCICGLPLQSLALDSNEIMEVPDAAGRLTALTRLSLTNNTIRKISEQVLRGLTLLVALFLQRNSLLQLPHSLAAPQQLSTLDASFNNLYSLPHCIGELTNLTVLRLAYNDLETASMTIDGLLNLEELVLTSNRLSGIPHSFANLRKLSTLQIGGNMFSVEPQHQFLKTYEATQKWLHHNLENYCHAESEQQTLVAPLRGKGMGLGKGGGAVGSVPAQQRGKVSGSSR